MNQKQMYNLCQIRHDFKSLRQDDLGKKKHHPEYTFQKLLQDIVIAQSHVDLSISS